MDTHARILCFQVLDRVWMYSLDNLPKCQLPGTNKPQTLFNFAINGHSCKEVTIVIYKTRGLHSLSENCDHNVGHFGILSYFSTLEEKFFQIGSNLTSVGSTFLHNLLL